MKRILGIDYGDARTGISITDLGLNEFRMDLVEYVKHNENLNKVPNGMHSVVFSDESIGLEKGVIYVLKNINNNVNIGANNAQSEIRESRINPNTQMIFKTIFDTFSTTVRIQKQINRVNSILSP